MENLPVKNILIFGASGQDGFYMDKFLGQKYSSYKRILVSRSEGAWLQGDISKRSWVNNFIKELKPEVIINFAAKSTTHHDGMFENYQTIVDGTVNLLEAVRLHSPHSKIFLCGSGLQFKNSGEPIDENTPFSATNAYSAARIASAYAARYFRDTHGILVYLGYLFHHDSPLRSRHHLSQNIATTAKLIASGRQDLRLKIGNLQAKKEYTFAGDVVEAIWAILNQESLFEAVIGSGIGYTVKDWLEVCFKLVNLDWSRYVDIDESFRKDFDILISQPDKIKELGWTPKVTFEQLASMMVLGEKN